MSGYATVGAAVRLYQRGGAKKPAGRIEACRKAARAASRPRSESDAPTIDPTLCPHTPHSVLEPLGRGILRCRACGHEGRPHTGSGKPLAIVYVEGEMRLGTLPFPGALQPLDPTVKDLHGAELVKALQKRPTDPCQHLYTFKSSSRAATTALIVGRTSLPMPNWPRRIVPSR